MKKNTVDFTTIKEKQDDLFSVLEGKKELIKRNNAEELVDELINSMDLGMINMLEQVTSITAGNGTEEEKQRHLIDMAEFRKDMLMNFEAAMKVIHEHNLMDEYIETAREFMA